MSTITVGVLALQGAFLEHIRLLKEAAASRTADEAPEWEFIEVRTPPQLARCDALILPGGESTAISLVAARSNLLEDLRDFVKYVPAKKRPLYSHAKRLDSLMYTGSIANPPGEHAQVSSYLQNPPIRQNRAARSSSEVLTCA